MHNAPVPSRRTHERAPAGRDHAGSEPDTAQAPGEPPLSATQKAQLIEDFESAWRAGDQETAYALLRYHGVSPAHLDAWRRVRDEGELAGLAPRKRGRKPSRSLEAQIATLRKHRDALATQVEHAWLVIEVQRRLAALFGQPLKEPASEDLAAAAALRKRQHHDR